MSAAPQIDLDAGGDWRIELVLNGERRTIDVYEAWSHLAQFREDNPADEVPVYEYNAKLAAKLGDMGYPGLSHRQAESFVVQLNRTIGELEKKADAATGSPAASPDSTDLTPSTGPATN